MFEISHARALNVQFSGQKFRQLSEIAIFGQFGHHFWTPWKKVYRKHTGFKRRAYDLRTEIQPQKLKF